MIELLSKIYTTGGPIVALLIAMSLASLTITLFKLLQFAQLGAFIGKSKPAVSSFLDHWRQSQKDSAMESLAGHAHPQVKILAHASRLLNEGKLKGKALNDELSRFGSSLVRELQSQLRVLEVIATLAPLIGLLGTVIGMIDAFQAMEAAGKQVDPSVLSGGIWKALLTTAVGLVVAIPASFIHSWLESKVESIAHQMSDSLGQLLAIQAEKSPSLQTLNDGAFPRAAS